MIMRGAPSLYPTSLVRGSRRVVLHRTRGLGQPNAPGCMSSSDFYAAIGPLQNCDPRDTNCVMCNQQSSSAVSNLVDSGCIQPGTPVSFSCDTSQAALQAFQSNNPLAVNATVGTGSQAFVAVGPQVTMQPPGQSAAQWWGGATSTVSGNPPPSTTPSPTGASPNNPLNQQVKMRWRNPAFMPLPIAPPNPSVVNPSPPSLLTSTGSAYLNPLSLVNQANGINLTSGQGVSTGSWFDDPTQELISGLPNWALLAMGGAGVFMVISIATRR